jgi:cold-inducible RNA-binding protein
LCRSACSFIAFLPFGPMLASFVRPTESKKGGSQLLTGDFKMSTKIYVGNLSYEADNASLDQMFKPYGTVASAQVIMDRDSGRSKGFGFVEMGTSDEAKAAIGALNGTEINGRAVTVNEAKPREDRPRSGGGQRNRY